MRKVILIVGGVVLLLLVLCGVLFGGGILALMGATQPVVDASDKFMTALRDNNFTGAYDMCAPSLQSELGDAAGLEAFVKDGGRQPATWNFTSRSINNDEGVVEGTATFAGGATGTARVVLSKVGNDWKISGLTLNNAP